MVRHELQEALTPEAEHFLVMAEEQSARAVTISENGLLGFVRQREPSFAAFDLSEVVDDVLEATPTPAGVNVTVNTADLRVSVDRDPIRRKCWRISSRMRTKPCRKGGA